MKTTKKQKKNFWVRRSPLDTTSDFQWWFTYATFFTKGEAITFLELLAENFSDHNIEMHEDYFIDHTTQTKTEILVI